jgi:gliding motility-associated-like protein
MGKRLQSAHRGNSFFFMLPFLCILFQSFIVSNSLFASPPRVIHYESDILRMPFNLEGSERIIIEGLECGQEYQFSVNSYRNEAFVGIKEVNGVRLSPDQSSLRFVAEAQNELTLNLSDLNQDFYFSLSKVKEDEPEPENQNMMAVISASNAGALTLVQDVFIGGGCFDISGVSYTGDNRAKGEFINGGTNIGIEDGVILCTGRRESCSGPNTGNPVNDINNDPGDGDLSQLSGVNTFDAAILEFDFIPTTDVISFEYVFASEEYCQYVGQSFNDVFGFFLSGPGINGPFSNAAINIAVLPTGQNVSIANVNHYTNDAFYISNGIPQTNNDGQGCNDGGGHPLGSAPAINELAYNGFTVVLTATAVIPQPCQTYHIKLAIADGGDNEYDSAIFLKSNSFSAGVPVSGTAVNPINNQANGYETCDGFYFEFCRDPDSDITVDQVASYTISPSSTATAGVDYTNIPLSVTIPAGQACVQLPIDVFEDNITEGPETIILEMDEACTCDASEVEFIINDTEPLESDIPDINECGTGPISISANPSGGVEPYSYEWSSGGTSATESYTPVGTETLFVTITDACDNEVVDEVDVTLVPPPTAELSGAGVICSNDASSSVDLSITFTGTGPWTFVYNDGTSDIELTTSDNPYTLTVSDPANYSLVSVTADSGNCVGTVSGSVDITESTVEPTASATDPSCNGFADGSITLTISGGTGPYTYTWSDATLSGQNPTGIGVGTYDVTVTDSDGCEGTTSITLSEPDPLEASIDPPLNIDCNNSTGSASVNVLGGTSPYTYLWSNSDDGSSLSTAVSGTFSVTVTDANGCEDTADVTITEDITPPVAVGVSTGIIDCNNSTITIDGVGSSTGTSFTYLWTTSGGSIDSGQNTLTPTVSSAGTYTLTVTNTDNGCEESVDVIVGEDLNEPNVVANGGEIDCVNSSITIDGIGSDTGAEFTYLWTASGGGNIVNGSTTLSPTVDAAGTYTLTVTNINNGCTSTETADVTADLTPPTVSLSADEITCAITSINISGSTSAGSGATILWTTGDGNIVSGETTLNPEVDMVGTYTITVTDPSNGCDNTESITVGENTTPPNADAGPNMVLDCNNSTVTLDASGSSGQGNLSYQWSTINGNILSGANTANPVVDLIGVYDVEITDAENGCTSTASVVVTEDFSTPNIVIAAPPFLDCNNSNDIIDASASDNGPNYSYQWTTSNGIILSGGNTLTPNVSAGGIYELEIINTSNGCSSVESVEVISDFTFPNVNAGPGGELTCTVSEIELDATNSDNGGIYAFYWITSNGGNIVSGLNTLTPTVNAAGTYSVTILNTVNGCESTDDVVITQDANVPVADAGPSLDINCTVSSVSLDGSGSTSGNDFLYEWTTSNGNIVNGSSSVSPTVDQAGTYTLTVTNLVNGCTATSSVDVAAYLDPVTAVIAPPPAINCFSPTVFLDGSSSTQGANIEYSWTDISGDIVSGDDTMFPQVGEEGTYILTVTNTLSTCTDETFVFVNDESVFPNIDYENPGLIDCLNEEVVIDASASDSGPSFVYSWSTFTGGLVSGGNTLTPTVNTSGSYELTVTNTQNNCSTTEEIEVFDYILNPNVNLSAPSDLNCQVTEVELNTTVSSGGTFTFVWSTDTGNFTGDENTLTPTLDAPGNYTILVTNTINNCSTTESVFVDQDINIPVADAGPPGTLTCSDPIYQIDASGSTSGSGIEYSWSYTDGNITAGQNTTSPQVNEPGLYTLTVNNTNNLCSASADLLILEDQVYPVADAGDDVLLGCWAPSLILDGSASSSGGDFVYAWSSSDGTIISSVDQDIIEVNSAGNYQLSVINTTNGCESVDNAIVVENFDVPGVVADPGGVLTCTALSIPLNATVSGAVDNFTYEWVFNGSGSIASGQGTTNAVANQPDVYYINVLDNVNGCVGTDSVIVTKDDNVPVVILDALDVLDCVTDSLIIDATASTQSPTISFVWETTDGVFADGEQTLLPTISSPGSYELTLYDSANDCETSSIINIEPDTIHPEIVLTTDGVINCYNGIIPVTSVINNVGSQYDFAWSVQEGGTIEGASNNLDIDVSTAGLYELSVLNLINGCTSADSVYVVEDLDIPVLTADIPEILTCSLTSVGLSASVDTQGDTYSFNWFTDTNGSLDNNVFTLNPNVSAASDYNLAVLNDINGCQDTLTITVTEDVDYPVAVASVNDFLSCQTLSLNIDAQGSTTGASMVYNWSTSDGSIVSGNNSLLPEVNQPGLYQLIVENTFNSCKDTLIAEVTQNIVAPAVTLLNPEVLTCSVLDVSVNADAGNNPPVTYEYAWFDQQNNFLGDNPDSIITAVPGVFNLNVIDTYNGCTLDISTTVTQDIVDPIADAGVADTLNCVVISQELSGVGSSQGALFTYQWTTNDGNIINQSNTLNPFVNAPGTYVLEVVNTFNNCVSESSVYVPEDVVYPLAEAGDTDILNCYVDELELNGTGSSEGGSFEYEWTSLDQNPIINNTTLSPTIDGDGTYQLRVRNLYNGCESIDSVLVLRDTLSPDLLPIESEILTCGRLETDLAMSSSVTDNVEFSWSTSNGSFTSATNIENPTVNMPGIYTLSYTNLNNGCSTDENVEVYQNIVLPVANAGSGGTITCEFLTIDIIGSASTNSGETDIQWITQNGEIVDGGTTINPTVGSEGTYTICVIDMINECMSLDSVDVSADQIYPIVSSVQSDILDCVTEEVAVDASSTTMQSQYVIAWSTPNGNFVSGTDGLSPLVDLAGQYVLSIEDTINGCITLDTMDVYNDYEVPVVSAGEDFILPCYEEFTILAGSAQSNTTLMQYSWSSPDGNILSGGNSLNPSIDKGGVYTLTVTNLVNGCENFDQTFVDEDVPNNLELVITDPLCFGLNGSLAVQNIEGGTAPYIYSFDGGESFTDDLIIGDLPEGEYEVLAQDANGCETDLQSAFIQAPPQLNIDVVSEVAYEQGETYQIVSNINYPMEDIASIQWTPAEGLSCSDCLSPQVLTQNSNVYQLEVVNNNGCLDRSIVTVFVDRTPKIFIPNTFSPDGDGENDVFMIFADIKNIEIVRTFKVFDRWGELVHEYYNFMPNDPVHGWDGTLRSSPLNPGVFVYHAEVEMSDGRIETFKGDVFLNR